MTLKNINVAVCDDETEVLDTIKNYLISYQIQYDIECATHTFSNGSDFLESLDKIKFNIVFLDIEMPEMDGLEIAKHIREKSADDVYIIFVTSYPSYMHDSFQVQPFQYIVKPVTRMSRNNWSDSVWNISHRCSASYITTTVTFINNLFLS